jgi:hypothetical protein
LLCATICLTAALTVPEVAQAQLMYFVPGDAYFRTRLTETLVDDVVAGKESRWDYVAPAYLKPDEPAFRGHVGCPLLQVSGIPAETAGNLKKLYHWLRASRPKAVSIEFDTNEKRLEFEINGFHCFFYPRSFNVERFSLGLKYNENWSRLGKPQGQEPKYSFGLSSVPYQPILRDYELTVQDWKVADQVDPLKATIDFELEHGPPEKRPALVKWSDVKLLVVAESDLEATIRNEPWHAVFEVLDKEIVRYEYERDFESDRKEYKLVRETWDPNEKPPTVRRVAK